MSAKRPGWGKRRVPVSPELLEALLVRGSHPNPELPDDARLLAIWPPKHEDEREIVTLLFESEAWDELPEGGLIPEIDPDRD